MFRPVARLKPFRLQTRCYSSASSSSSQENPELVPDKDADKAKAVAQKTVFGKWLPSKDLGIFGRREPVPWTSALPNPKGVENYDPQFKLGELVDDAPAVFKEHTGKLVQEVKENFGLFREKPKDDAYVFLNGAQHGEVKVEYTFKDEKSLDIWYTGCDADWNEGYSNMELIRTERGTALFRGNISSRLPKDGKIQRAGWAAIKTQDFKAFLRKKTMNYWKHYTHFIIKCRGDGRQYKLMLYAPGIIDLTWGDTWSYPLHTHGGPYWQYEKVAFSRFIHTVWGRVQDKQTAVSVEHVSSIGIVLMDRIDGPFELEIDFIGAYNDTTHKEQFAYEGYVMPMIYTDTA
ncbi:Protein NUAF-1 [Aphelenchoides avenae]|nr:Protein NUAF-1 [Aphelenchus avenae]